MDSSTEVDHGNIEQIKFNGKAGDYFGVWLVNHLFTWMTLGIYSAWAKVRTLQFFYGHTELAGGRFQFTAEPLKILRGRVIAALLFVLYFVVENVQSSLANAVLATMVIAFFVFAPVLTVLVMSFKLRYSEWRGISFGFNKNYREAYRVYLIPVTFIGLFLASCAAPFYSTEIEEYFGYQSPVYQPAEEHYDDDNPYELDSDATAYGEEGPEDDYYQYQYDDEGIEGKGDDYMNPYLAIPAVIFGLLVLTLFPYFDFINMRFLSRNAKIGQASFFYHAVVKDYYVIYGKWFVVALVLAGLWAIESWGVLGRSLDDIDLAWLLIFLTIVFVPASRAYFKSSRYNLLLNKTLVDGKHQLIAKTTFPMLFWIMISNSVVVVLSLGMMSPWAQVRTVRYVLNCSAVEVSGSLDEFVAAQEEESNALAEEVADMFDIDILG